MASTSYSTEPWTGIHGDKSRGCQLDGYTHNTLELLYSWAGIVFKGLLFTIQVLLNVTGNHCGMSNSQLWQCCI